MEKDVGDWTPIPGETPIDPSFLKDRSKKTRRELNRAEAKNIAKAHVKYLASKPTKRIARFVNTWFLKVHEDMYNDVWQWAGRMRDEDLNLGVPVVDISSQLLNLERDLAVWKESMDAAEQAARLHHRAVWIHPFYNGNGRWARLITNIWLRLNGAPVVDWPENDIGEENIVRGRYLEALRAADRGDFAPLIALHNEYMGQAEDS